MMLFKMLLKKEISIPSNFHLARMLLRPPLVGKCLAKMQLAAKLTGTRPDPDMIHHIIWGEGAMLMVKMMENTNVAT